MELEIHLRHESPPAGATITITTASTTANNWQTCLEWCFLPSTAQVCSILLFLSALLSDLSSVLDSDSNDHESVQEVAKDEEDYEDAEHMIDTGRERRPFRFSKGDEGSLQHSVDRENEHAQAKIAEYGQRLAHCSTRQCRKRLRRKIATRREEISQRGRDLDRVMGLINAGGNSKEIKRLISALLKKEMHATDPISLDLIDQEEETEDAEVKNIYHIKRNEKECQSGRCRQRMKRRELSVYNNGNIRRKSLNHLIERIKLVEV